MSRTVRSAGSAALAFSLTAGLIGLLAADPAAARDLTVTAKISEELPIERVSTAGLDLSTHAGVRLLEGRVRSAGRKVCNGATLSIAAPSELRCRRDVVAAAEPRIASLSAQARSLAAAGLPAVIDTAFAVIAPQG